MCFSKTSVNFGCCYGIQGWAGAVEKIFVLEISPLKLSGGTMSPPGWDRVKLDRATR